MTDQELENMMADRVKVSTNHSVIDFFVKCQLHWHINLKAFSSLFEQLDQLEKSKKEEIATTRNDNN